MLLVIALSEDFGRDPGSGEGAAVSFGGRDTADRSGLRSAKEGARTYIARCRDALVFPAFRMIECIG